MFSQELVTSHACSGRLAPERDILPIFKPAASGHEGSCMTSMRPSVPSGLGRPRLILHLGATAVLICALALPGKWAAVEAANPPDDPGSAVKAALDDALAILKDRNTQLTVRRRKLHELAAQHLDFADMARSALGVHWNELSEKRRKEFVPMFTAFMEDAYLDKIQDYSELRVQHLRLSYRGESEAQVDAQVIPANNDEPVALTFYLRREEGGWKVYDVAFDSIRLVANYRTQFNRIINGQGFEALMAELRQKEANLDALLGK